MRGRPAADWRTLLPSLASALESNRRAAPSWVAPRTQRLAHALCRALVLDLARASRQAGSDVLAEAVTRISPETLSRWRARGWVPRPTS